MRLLYPLLLSLIFITSCSNEKDTKTSINTPGIFPRSQVSTYIRRIFQDRNGSLWLGTTEDGVYRYDGKSLTSFSKKEGLAGVCVKAIAEDKTGHLWFATEGGISKFDGNRFTNFTVKDGLTDNDVWSILPDRNGIIWFGTMTGVNRYDGQSFTTFPLPKTDVVSTDSRFNPNSVVSICEDKPEISGSAQMAQVLGGTTLQVHSPLTPTKTACLATTSGVSQKIRAEISGSAPGVEV